jgi:hypothetical protein
LLKQDPFLYCQEVKKREELATLIQLLQQYHNAWQQKQQQQGNEEDQNIQDSGAPFVPDDYLNLPNPMPADTKFFRSQDGVTKDETKRGSCKYRRTYVTDLGQKLKVTHGLTCNNNSSSNDDFFICGTGATCNLILEYDTI